MTCRVWTTVNQAEDYAEGFPLMAVIAAEGPVLDRVLDETCRSAHGGPQRRAYGTLHAAQMKTTWGRRCQRPFALIEGQEMLASAEQYDLTGVLDGRAVRVCGIGEVHSVADRRGPGHARQLVETLLSNAARDGAEMALLFSHTGMDDEIGGEFEAIQFTDLTLSVAQSPRHGAPMTRSRS